MIIPDTKNWTWVIDHACPECGFDASACRGDEVAELLRENAQAWQDLLRRGAIVRRRPDNDTWSGLEYSCHVLDVLRRYRARIELMMDEVDPLFANWDQDASAVEDRYQEQDPVTVIGELVGAAQMLAAQLDQVSGSMWQRGGRRSDGASFTVDSIARYMVHDVIHHRWDVLKQLQD